MSGIVTLRLDRRQTVFEVTVVGNAGRAARSSKMARIVRAPMAKVAYHDLRPVVQ